MRANENGQQYDVLFLGGLTVSLYKLTNNALKKLRGMHADVLLAAHGFWFDLEGKAARQKDGAPDPFVDPTELDRHLNEMQNDLDEALQAQEATLRMGRAYSDCQFGYE